MFVIYGVLKMEYILVMLIFGVICGVIADSRGRSTLRWSLLGFLLPLVGLILVLALPSLKTGLPKNGYIDPTTGVAREKRTCPDCAEEVLKAAKICKYCGYRV